jgi:hypothetical protein
MFFTQKFGGKQIKICVRIALVGTELNRVIDNAVRFGTRKVPWSNCLGRWINMSINVMGIYSMHSPINTFDSIIWMWSTDF